MSPELSPYDPALVSATIEMAEVFRRAHVRYALIGGLAVSKRTHPRYTRDLDFLLAIPQLALPGLLEELHQHGFEFDLVKTIREWTQEHMTVLSRNQVRIDWVKPVLPAYQHVLEQATDEIWFHHPVRVASAEGLVLLKLLAFRLQDQADIETLIAGNASKLDFGWIKAEWQAIAGLDEPRMRWLTDLVEKASRTE